MISGLQTHVLPLLIGIFALSCVENTEPLRVDVQQTTSTAAPPLEAPALEAVRIDTFPTKISGTTVGGTRSYDRYSCRPETNESGPERTYQLDLPHAGFLAIEVLNQGAGADIDVHLMSKNDHTTCLSGGNHTAGAYLEAGTYWLVADTWVDDEGIAYAGTFELAVNLVRPKNLQGFGMNPELAKDALKAFSTAWQRSETKRFEYAITDFSLHSRDKRHWIVHMATGELLYHFEVGHGEGSVVGEETGVASAFSNTSGSHQSSLGLARTAETYTGMYGYSLRLDGLEPGFNDKIRERLIVVHPWHGNTAESIATKGWVVPAKGCATIAPSISADVIDTISGGALMYFWYPDPVWRGSSTYL